HVEVGARQQVAQRGALGEGVTAQIDSGQEGMLQHGTNSLRPASGAVRPFQWLIQVASGDRPHTRTTFISRSVFNPSPYRASPVVRRTEPASMREGGESRDRGGGAAQRRDAGGPDTRGGGHVAGLPQRQ